MQESEVVKPTVFVLTFHQHGEGPSSVESAHRTRLDAEQAAARFRESFGREWNGDWPCWTRLSDYALLQVTPLVIDG